MKLYLSKFSQRQYMSMDRNTRAEFCGLFCIGEAWSLYNCSFPENYGAYGGAKAFHNKLHGWRLIHYKKKSQKI